MRLYLSLVLITLSNIGFGQSLDSLRLLMPEGHIDNVNCLRESHDNKLYASANIFYPYYLGSLYAFPSDNRIIIWNDHGVPMHILDNRSFVGYLSDFSTDNKRIISSGIDRNGRDILKLWDVEKGLLIDSFRVGDFQIIQFMSPSEFFVYGENEITIINYHNNKAVVKSKVILRKHNISKVFFSRKQASLIIVTTNKVLQLPSSILNDSINSDISNWTVKDSVINKDRIKIISYDTSRVKTFNPLNEVKYKYYSISYGGISEADCHYVDERNILILKTADEKSLFVYDFNNGTENIIEILAPNKESRITSFYYNYSQNELIYIDDSNNIFQYNFLSNINSKIFFPDLEGDIRFVGAIESDSLIYIISQNSMQISFYDLVNTKLLLKLTNYQLRQGITSDRNDLKVNLTKYNDKSIWPNGICKLDFKRGIIAEFYGKTTKPDHIRFDSFHSKLLYSPSAEYNRLTEFDLLNNKIVFFETSKTNSPAIFDFVLNESRDILFATTDRSYIYNLSKGNSFNFGLPCQSINPTKNTNSFVNKYGFQGDYFYTIFNGCLSFDSQSILKVLNTNKSGETFFSPKYIKGIDLKTRSFYNVSRNLLFAQNDQKIKFQPDTLFSVSEVIDYSVKNNRTVEESIKGQWDTISIDNGQILILSHIFSFTCSDSTLIVLSSPNYNNLLDTNTYQISTYGFDSLCGYSENVRFKFESSIHYETEMELIEDSLILFKYPNFLYDLKNEKNLRLIGEVVDISIKSNLILTFNKVESEFIIYDYIDFEEVSRVKFIDRFIESGNIYWEGYTRAILVNELIAVNTNNGLKFYNFNGSNVFTINSLENGNFLTRIQSGYYLCSKNVSKNVHYYYSNNKIIGFDQLDPIYNRPDIVLDSIGNYFGGANQELVQQYKDAWEKRVERLGLDREMLATGEIAVPDAVISNEAELAYENTDGFVEIDITAKDPKYKLKRYNVYVNEVPIYGSNGVSISGLNVQEWESTINIPLSVGENKIQVSVMNELGLQNFKYPTYVNYVPKEDIVSKTYYVGIGVNDFEDPKASDLRFCVNDVKSLAEGFYRMGNTDTLLLTNAEVTVSNIKKIKNYLLKNVTVNDRVIISCSSHGLLDGKNQFYLALHNTDFSNPEVNGLPYEELENLLDSIPARKKLLMIDACNSGENEILENEEEMLAMTEGLDEKARGISIQTAIEEQKSSFETMMELFVNVQNESGTVVISAAGGKQSALEAIKVEGKFIENGAFTYSVLEYLQKDEDLTVNGLKNYVEHRVVEITGGKQQPTSRQETMEVDWGLR